MKIDRSKINFMPLIGGPIYDQENIPGAVYSRVETLILQYETDPEAIPPLLPERSVTRTGHSRGSLVLRNDKNGRIR